MQPTPSSPFGQPGEKRASTGACFPHPRIAAAVQASHHACRGGSRGYRRPFDITPKIRRSGRRCQRCRVAGAHPKRSMRQRWQRRLLFGAARPPNLRYVQTPASTSMCFFCVLLLQHIVQLLHSLRSSARHPWLASPSASSVVARGCGPRLRPPPVPRAGTARRGLASQARSVRCLRTGSATSHPSLAAKRKSLSWPRWHGLRGVRRA